MNAEQQLILYSRTDCHLCEVAMDLLGQLGITCRIVNIESDLSLISRYGVRIPVLSRADDAATLDWPFDAAQVHEFIAGSSCT